MYFVIVIIVLSLAFFLIPRLLETLFLKLTRDFFSELSYGDLFKKQGDDLILEFVIFKDDIVYLYKLDKEEKRDGTLLSLRLDRERNISTPWVKHKSKKIPKHEAEFVKEYDRQMLDSRS